uniref:Uncharacterized protein n=1 Tax=Eutreptiella gymnastica TaxID=73025 RepID=A0A7S4FNI0_9EUGL
MQATGFPGNIVPWVTQGVPEIGLEHLPNVVFVGMRFGVRKAADCLLDAGRGVPLVMCIQESLLNVDSGGGVLCGFVGPALHCTTDEPKEGKNKERKQGDDGGYADVTSAPSFCETIM